VKTANEKFKEDRKAIEKVDAQIGTLKTARKASVDKAIADFKTALEKAKADLKAAWGGQISKKDDPKLRVISPNGGEKLETGTTRAPIPRQEYAEVGKKHIIKWNSEGLPLDTKIKLSLFTPIGPEGGRTFAETSNSGSYEWSPVELYGYEGSGNPMRCPYGERGTREYTLHVRALKDDGINVIASDTSDQTFTLTGPCGFEGY
jgi:hypothetical protein